MQRLRTIVLAVLMLTVGVVTPAVAVTNPTIAAWAPISVTYGTAPVAITPPASNSPGGWTYATGSSGVAVVSGNVLTFTGIGTTTLYGTQAASGDFASATAMTTITVSGVAPTLGPWPDFSIAYGSIGSATLVPPSSNSTGAWTYTSSNPAVASISGNVITFNAVGSTVITGVQAASGAYLAATATRTLTVAGSSPSVGSWPALTVALKPFASNAFTLTPPSSNSPGAWSYTSSDTSTVSITGDVATPLKPGSATITAVQAAAGGYGASAPVTTTISVTAAMPTLGTWPALTKASTDPDFTLTPPTSPSAGTWSYVSSDTAVATVAGNTVHIVGPGSTTLTATQVANWMWAQAQVSTTLTVSGTATGGTTGSTQSGGTTTGTPGAHAPMAIGVGDTVAIADLIPGIWMYTSSNPAVATVLGTTLTGMKAGTVTISGVLAGSTVYTKANPLTFTAKVQTRATVGNFANITVKVGAKARAKERA